MNMRGFLIALLVLAMPWCINAQVRTGCVYDAQTKEALPFATIRFGNSGQGLVAGLDAKFEVPAGITVSFIEVSSLGYKTQKVSLPAANLQIYLAPDNRYLDEVTVKPPYEKMRRIINNAIENRARNNPDKYDWYQCHVYYKMLVDAIFTDSVLNDTTQDSREIKEFTDRQHLLISETYSKRTWKQPLQLQEDIIASRFSGLKKPGFTSLVTDFQPFHAYNDYISLNGKEYHNPISRGFEQYYKFNLSDELLLGADTVWVLSFTPRSNNANNLAGKVYINSDGYAISQIVARSYDTMLHLNVRIEQQYDRVPVPGAHTRWFPSHLNYIIDLQMKMDNSPLTYHWVGYSRIDSVNWQEDHNFKFDKAHTVRKAANADAQADWQWLALRRDTLQKKEANTYHFIDSLGGKMKFDKWLSYVSKLPDSKVPAGPVDVDIRRLLSVNKYEGTRLGLGLQTNEQLVKWLSVGGWFGYGFKDKEWKYGAFAEVYADKYKEFVLRVGYSNDLFEPGRIRLNRDLDKGYLKRLLLARVDQVKEYTASVRKKLGYWNVELSGTVQDVAPRYPYAFNYWPTTDSAYFANELSFSFRYAYGERTVPFFNIYKRQASKYPIVYGKITTGTQTWQNSDIATNYLQAIAAVQWHKHINRLGNERVLVVAGKVWSERPLPLGKLFAGNGFKYDTKYNTGLYTFGGMMNMYPYEYYSDRFVNLILRHDFDWKIFKLERNDSRGSIAPNLALQYNMLYGALSHPEAQLKVAFGVPDNGYHEAGIIVNNLIRLRYFDLCYLTLNMGYFVHITPGFDSKRDGRIVYGVGLEF